MPIIRNKKVLKGLPIPIVRNNIIVKSVSIPIFRNIGLVKGLSIHIIPNNRFGERPIDTYLETLGFVSQSEYYIARTGMLLEIPIDSYLFQR